jgi:hypothetical protein
MTPRQPMGVRMFGEGGSHKESSLLPIGHLGVIYDSQPDVSNAEHFGPIRAPFGARHQRVKEKYIWKYLPSCVVLYSVQ